MNKNNREPNLFLVGAAKSGTSSFAAYLDKHPEIFICPEKECHYFSNFIYKNFNGYPWDEYRRWKQVNDYSHYLSRHFSNAAKELVVGDASTDYLYYYETSISNIKKELGDDVKILIILRNPVKACFSRYKHSVRRTWEGNDFSKAISLWEEREKKGYIWDFDYINAFKYSRQVEAYMDAFDNVKVIILEEFMRDKEKVYRDVLQYLNVNPDFIPDNLYERYNSSINTELPVWLKYLRNPHFLRKAENMLPVSMHKILNAWLSEKVAIKTKHVPAIDHEDMSFLEKEFREDILKLEELLHRKIPDWK